jgi:hypothetical protein
MGQHTKVCSECPFSRAGPPGALGGSPPEMYVGQVNHPTFWLPCHCACDFSDPNWKTNVAVAQCVGAATFRANVGVVPGGSILRLPPNAVDVFADFAEFLMHHKQVSRDEAEAQLRRQTPADCTRVELLKQGVVTHLVPRKE